MGLKRGVAGMRWNHHDIGSRAIDRILFDPGCDGLPSSDAAFPVDVIGSIIHNQQRDLDICNHLFHRRSAGLHTEMSWRR